MDPEKNSASAAGQGTERSGPVTNRVPRDDLRKTVITVNEVNGHFYSISADARFFTVRKQPSGFESGISYKQGVTGSSPSSPTQAFLVTDHDGL